MIGKNFGTMLVLSASNKSTTRRKYFNVECRNCGHKATMMRDNLVRAKRTGKSGCKSCVTRTHGLTKHPAYKTWEGIISRCYNPDHQAYDDYGGRGIFVCDEWRTDPTSFIEWIDQTIWERGVHQVDREDNDGPYAPWNVRIVTSEVNNNNRRVNRRFSVDGVSYTISEASRHFGVGATTIKQRLDRGLTGRDVVTKSDGRRRT